LGDSAETVEADASAKEALGNGFHAVLPGSVPVHSDVPVSGTTHSGENQEEAAFGDGPADRTTPIGYLQAFFDELAGDQFADAACEIGDVAELAWTSDGEV